MISCDIETLDDINMIKRELDRLVVVGCFRSIDKICDESLWLSKNTHNIERRWAKKSGAKNKKARRMRAWNDD